MLEKMMSVIISASMTAVRCAPFICTRTHAHSQPHKSTIKLLQYAPKTHAIMNLMLAHSTHTHSICTAARISAKRAIAVYMKTGKKIIPVGPGPSVLVFAFIIFNFHFSH